MVVLRRLLKESNAQALVEFALIIPLMLLLLFGITEYGRVFYTYLVASHASREAARVAALGGNETKIKAAGVHAGAPIGVDTDDVEFDPAPELEPPDPEVISVTVIGHVELVTPFINTNLFPIEWSDLNGDNKPDDPYHLYISRTTFMRRE